MTTPVLESLNALYPDAKIDIVTDARSCILYTHCPYRDRIILKDKSHFLRGAFSIIFRVRERKYDLVVDLRTDGLAYLFRGKRTLTKFGSKPYGGHAVERLMGVIHRLHKERRIPESRVWISKDEQDFADSMLGSLPGKTWLALAPDNLDKRKVWPEENYIRLINHYSTQIDGIILEGSEPERECAQRIANKINTPSVILAGRTNLLQAAAAITRAAVFLGSDSGLGHIAGAVSTPSVLFYSVDNPDRVAPWRGDVTSVISKNEQTSNIPVTEAIERLGGVLQRLQS
jgi:heptosyltransferase-3